jgi:hypothetical protein
MLKHKSLSLHLTKLFINKIAIIIIIIIIINFIYQQ